jgi:septal ring factor EnvC (AmiA/AmiB activator)
MSFSQSKKELEKKRQKTQKEIQITNELLKQTQRDKKLTMNQLNIVNKQIKAREELILTIGDEVKQLNERITENRQFILLLHADLEQIKKEYVKMIRFAWYNRSNYDKLMFVLSSDDFNQAYRRIKYIQQYNEYRKKQAVAIMAISEVLKNKMESLEEKKKFKEQLLGEEKQETNALSETKKEQSKMVDNLQKKEKDLQKQLEKQKRADSDLKKAISDLIAEEIRKANEKKKAEANKAIKDNKTVPKTNETIYALTPEEQLLSNSFNANVGKLPWPTERGIITGSFGEHDHPVLAGIKVKNDGVYISTTPGSRARSIFDGEVRQIISIPGKHKVLIIKHGNFLSVYSNLSDVSVKIGQKVKAKQDIGVIFTDNEDDNKTIIELQMWDGTTKLNPELWLSKNK